MTETNPMVDVDELVEYAAGEGVWVREVYKQTDEWHRSIRFDGEIHSLGCGYMIAAQTRVEEVENDIEEQPADNVCDGCAVFWEREQGEP